MTMRWFAISRHLSGATYPVLFADRPHDKGDQARMLVPGSLKEVPLPLRERPLAEIVAAMTGKEPPSPDPARDALALKGAIAKTEFPAEVDRITDVVLAATKPPQFVGFTS